MTALTIFAGSIVLDAMGDAYNDEGNRVLGHALNAASVGVLLASPFVLDLSFKDVGWYAISYLSFRVALFDPIYNTTRGLPLGYIGDTSLWDKGLQAFNPPPSALLLGRAWFFTLAIVVPINEIK